MTTENYSIQGLKDLLNELENLATCISGMPKNRISDDIYSSLMESQFILIQEASCYCSILINKSNI